MAHPTDYNSQKDIHKLRLSNRPKIVSYHASHANILVHNFLRENSNWAIDSLVTYLMRQYAEFGVTKEIVAHEIKSYIIEKV